MKLEVYESTVNVLVEAYRKCHLEHGNCSACAVGNIIANALGFSVGLSPVFAPPFGVKEELVWQSTAGYCSRPQWQQLFCTKSSTGQSFNLKENPSRTAYHQIESTGLHIKELMSIEEAFEMALHKSQEGYDYWKKDENKKEGQYMGLCAVLDVMAGMIEENKENSTLSQGYNEKLEEIAAVFKVAV